VRGDFFGAALLLAIAEGLVLVERLLPRPALALRLRLRLRPALRLLGIRRSDWRLLSNHFLPRTNEVPQMSERNLSVATCW
jgi:hypothetical protein